MNYTIVVGTNRKDSNSNKVALFFKEKYKLNGVDSQLINLADLPSDFSISNMFGNRNADFESIQKLVSTTDKFIFVIPEYNGSFPGILKLFIDGCEFPDSFKGKKCALVGLSSGQFGNLRGLEHFTGVAHYVKMSVFHEKIYLPKIKEQTLLEDLENNTFLNQLINQQIKGFIQF